MKKFTRTIEDFTCGHCSAFIKGDGYTNHCPKCLWSRHVDINPGDRQHTCGGMMEPVGIELRKKQYYLTHQCQKCGELTHCKTLESDSVEALTKLSETLAKKAFF